MTLLHCRCSILRQYNIIDAVINKLSKSASPRVKQWCYKLHTSYFLSSVGWVWAMLPRKTWGGADVCVFDCGSLQTTRNFVAPLLRCGHPHTVTPKNWKQSCWSCHTTWWHIYVQTYKEVSAFLLHCNLIISKMKKTPESSCSAHIKSPVWVPKMQE